MFLSPVQWHEVRRRLFGSGSGFLSLRERAANEGESTIQWRLMCTRTYQQSLGWIKSSAAKYHLFPSLSKLKRTLQTLFLLRTYLIFISSLLFFLGGRSFFWRSAGWRGRGEQSCEYPQQNGTSSPILFSAFFVLNCVLFLVLTYSFLSLSSMVTFMMYRTAFMLCTAHSCSLIYCCVILCIMMQCNGA
jgi:hypothetical protein